MTTKTLVPWITALTLAGAGVSLTKVFTPERAGGNGCCYRFNGPPPYGFCGRLVFGEKAGESCSCGYYLTAGKPDTIDLIPVERDLGATTVEFPKGTEGVVVEAWNGKKFEAKQRSRGERVALGAPASAIRITGFKNDGELQDLQAWANRIVLRSSSGKAIRIEAALSNSSEEFQLLDSSVGGREVAWTGGAGPYKVMVGSRGGRWKEVATTLGHSFMKSHGDGTLRIVDSKGATLISEAAKN